MPTIFKWPRKKRNYSGERYKSEAQAIYQHPRWRKLRDAYLMTHPVCEVCERNGKVTPAAEVHHKRPFMEAPEGYERYALAFDVGNLMSVCEQCHHDLHRAMRERSLQGMGNVKKC